MITWLFDFDGTLIDSRPGILSSYESALRKVAPEQLGKLNQVRIGPPLPAVAKTLFGEDRSDQVEAFVAQFKIDYDNGGINDTIAYDGVSQLLASLYSRGHRLVIATNKRAVPTRKILDMFDWTKYFTWIGCLDEMERPELGKDELLAHYFRQFERGDSCIFVGDTVGDALVAKNFCMPFVRAAYGYEPEEENWKDVPCWKKIDQALELDAIASNLM